jgi:hypothetical protein
MVFALLAAITVTSGPVFANTCQAGKLTCITIMPVGGYCECQAHGTTEGGTVVSKSATHQPVNATAGGCGAHPEAPGCHR